MNLWLYCRFSSDSKENQRSHRGGKQFQDDGVPAAGMKSQVCTDSCAVYTPCVVIDSALKLLMQLQLFVFPFDC